MNTYVSPNNQKLLWKTMLRFPLFTNKYDKDIWFKTVVGQFYENNKSNTTISLKEINLHTINYMVKRLQDDAAASNTANGPSIQRVIFPGENTNNSSVTEPAPTLEPYTSFPAPTAAAATSVPYTQQDFINIRRNEFDAKLQQKENEHRELLQKEIPPEIDFRDKPSIDGQIANIGDLMKLEIEKRNRDMQNIFLSGKPPQLQQQQTQQKRVSWKDEDSDTNTSNESISNERLFNLYEKIAADLEYIKILLENRFATTSTPPKLPEIYPSMENIEPIDSPLLENEESVEKKTNSQASVEMGAEVSETAEEVSESAEEVGESVEEVSEIADTSETTEMRETTEVNENTVVRETIETSAEEVTSTVPETSPPEPVEKVDTKVTERRRRKNR